MNNCVKVTVDFKNVETVKKHIEMQQKIINDLLSSLKKVVKKSDTKPAYDILEEYNVNK